MVVGEGEGGRLLLLLLLLVGVVLLPPTPLLPLLRPTWRVLLYCCERVD